MKKIDIKLEWKINDCWIGVFWKTSLAKRLPNFIDLMRTEMWICLLPCLPIHISYTWEYNEVAA